MLMNRERKIIQLYKDTADISGHVELLDYLGDDGLTCVNAARVSFDQRSESLTKKDHKLLEYLLQHRHTSVFEHNVLTFSFKVPLFVARQHMRHRTWSFNEISRRYTSSNLEFYLPNCFRKQSKSNRQGSLPNSSDNPVLSTVYGTFMDYNCKASEAIKKHAKNSLELYNSMLDNEICREQSRMVLPQNLYTHYWGTVNLNNFIKFIELRDHEGSQKEIQEVARACKTLVKQIWPNIIELYEKKKE
jgi:thymidylate synthase (FAD)